MKQGNHLDDNLGEVDHDAIEFYSQPWFMAEHPSVTFERMIMWDTVLGYGKTPDDVIKRYLHRNGR